MMKRKNVLFVMIMLLIMCLVGCGNSETLGENNSCENEMFENKTPEDIQFILDREVFYLKEESPTTYSNFVHDIDILTSYKENWTFEQFLNDDYFEDINWTTNEFDDEQKTITFSGTSTKTLDKAKVTIVFYIQEQAAVPLIWSIEISGDESTGSMAIQDYIDMGLNSTEALFAIDTSASCTIAILCEQNTTKENDSLQSGTSITQENSSSGNGTTNDYYLNEQGYLVDKVTEFETQTFEEYVVKYPILNEGVDEVVVYEFDTYDNIHVVLDASNVYQQVSLDEMGDYGDVQLEQVAPGRDIAYMFDGERYYIEDYTINLLTISKPINGN